MNAPNQNPGAPRDPDHRLRLFVSLLKQDVERASLAEIGTPDREWRVIGPRAA